MSDLTAADVELDRRLEHAQQQPAGIDLLRGELLDRCVRLVPAAEHDEWIRAFGERAPLAGPVAARASEREALVEIAERLDVLVTLEAPVREPEEAGTCLVQHVVG